MSCVADVVCQCPGLSALQRADGENRSEKSRRQPRCYNRGLLQQNRQIAAEAIARRREMSGWMRAVTRPGRSVTVCEVFGVRRALSSGPSNQKRNDANGLAVHWTLDIPNWTAHLSGVADPPRSCRSVTPRRPARPSGSRQIVWRRRARVTAGTEPRATVSMKIVPKDWRVARPAKKMHRRGNELDP